MKHSHLKLISAKLEKKIKITDLRLPGEIFLKIKPII